MKKKSEIYYMMQLRFCRFFLFLFLLAAPLAAKETSSLPDPSNLSFNWWNYFDEPDHGTLPEKIQSLKENLSQSVTTISEAHKEKAIYLLERISSNLDAFSIASRLPAPALSQSVPIAPHYTLDQLLDLSREIRKKEIALRFYRDDRIEKYSQTDRSQDCLDRLYQTYTKSENRSEEKFLLGLEMIACQASFETSKHQLVHLSRIIDAETQELNRLYDEIKNARLRITVNHMDLVRYAANLEKAERAWNQQKALLLANEAESTKNASPGLQPLEQAANRESEEQQLKLKIEEIASHNQVLIAQGMLALGKLIHDPAAFNLNSFNASLGDWKKIQESHKQKNEDTIRLLQKLLQNTGQLLSLTSTSTENSNALVDLEQQIIRDSQGNLLLAQKLQSDLEDSAFLLHEVEAELGQLMGSGERWFLEFIDFAQKTFEKARDWINAPLFHIGDNPVTFNSIIRFFFIMLIAVWISHMITRALSTFALNRQGIHKSLVYRVTRLAKYLILSLGLILGLTSIGFDFSSLLLLAGALGVGLGFGLQSIFNNFVSGIIILFESHLKVGDYIELESGIKGEIREIHVRSTIISTSDGSDIIVPNSEMISSKVINWTLRDPYRRLHIPFTVGTDTDKELLSKVIIETAKKVPHTLDKPGISAPKVYMTNFGSSGLEFELAVWVDERSSLQLLKTKSDYLTAIDMALQENRAAIPHPKQEIFLRF